MDIKPNLFQYEIFGEDESGVIPTGTHFVAIMYEQGVPSKGLYVSHGGTMTHVNEPRKLEELIKFLNK